MKTRFLLLLSFFLLASCNGKQQANMIAPENNLCICAKDYRPVCTQEGITYPNACQAQCDGVKNFSEGACNSGPIEANE